MSTISFWDRMIRLPNGRLGKDIMADAVKDVDNPFTKKLIAAMEAVFGQSPDLSVAMSGRHKFKAPQPPLPRNCEEMSRFSRAMRVWGDRVPSPATGLDAYAQSPAERHHGSGNAVR